MMKNVSLLLAVSLGLLGGCLPKLNLPPNEIEQLKDLEHVMDVQRTIADPQFKKIGKPSYTDEEWADLADVGSRLQVTSRKTKEFSKGPQFDALADQLGKKAEALAVAASAKDVKAATASLAEIKWTCKTCHSKFR